MGRVQVARLLNARIRWGYCGDAPAPSTSSFTTLPPVAAPQHLLTLRPASSPSLLHCVPPPQRVESNEDWSLFCPNEGPGLADVWGDEFDKLYTQ